MPPADSGSGSRGGAMYRPCRFLAVAALIATPAAAVAQTGYGSLDPPIPTGPPLPPPPAETRHPTWLEDGPQVLPASATMGGLTTVTDTPWPVTHSGSACTFDGPEPGPSWMMPALTSIQVLQGAYFNGRLGPRIPTFNYLFLSVRHGWNLGNPMGPNAPIGGNWEFLSDLTGAAITSSYGNWFAGLSFFLR